ncbi:MAG: MFS transporter [Chlamydiales bacterium]
MHKLSIRNQISGIIGNLLEHYDTALFSLLAPFLAPIFFTNKDPLTALIFTYSILCSGFLVRPIGAILFGWIGDSFGRKQALSISLLGMSITTICIGFIPSYREIGLCAPILLTIGRMSQSFFAAGESTGGAIFVLENTSKGKQELFSGLYDACAIGGMLIASAITSYMSRYTDLESTWRILFWGGGATAIIGCYLRCSNITHNVIRDKLSLLSILKKNKKVLISIIIASGFSYSIYSLAFSLMNGYIPLITSFSKTTMLQINTILIGIDMLLLPLFGYLSNRLGMEKVMITGATLASVCAIPLFAILQHGTLPIIILVRIIIVVLGVSFSATYHAWTLNLTTPCKRYLILSLAYAFGSQCIGMPTASICLWLYKITNWSGAPGIYLMCLGILASWTIYSSSQRMTISKSNLEIANL